MLTNGRYSSFKQEIQIGEHTFCLPDPPNMKDIAGYDGPTMKHKFIPSVIKFDNKTAIKEEWKKRNEGYWFMNKGNIEYITGTHYFYINNWVIDCGLPKFRDSDRDFFYLWKMAEDNKNSFGLLDIENRRGGKTYRALCILFERISKAKDAHGGIQSKTNSDSSRAFQKMILSWQRLALFYKPVDIGESHPKSSLQFFEPGRRDTKTQQKEYAAVLRSWIDYQNSKEEAYDGDKLHTYFDDEFGKCVETNTANRWQIVRECLCVGNKIVGKAIHTTTVEEMEKKGGKNAKILWDGSDKKTIDDNGRTITGLFRYFKPSYYGLEGFIDEYGYSDIDGARRYLENKRKKLSGLNLYSEMRKYPFTIDEAFRFDNKTSSFSLEKIYQQIDFNETSAKEPYVRGNFIWKNGVRDNIAIWAPDSGGKWKMVHIPDKEKRNVSDVRLGKRRPATDSEYVSGVDPFDHRATTDNRMSNAASYVFRRFNPLNPHDTNIFVLQYIARPPKPEIFYEDMIMQCFFYGAQLLAESNRPGLLNYFRERGYEGYLMKRPEPTHTEYSRTRQKEYGIPMTGEAPRDALINAIQSYIYENIGFNSEENVYGRCYFEELLHDWVEFDPDNWTEYDATVASGMTLLATMKVASKPHAAAIPFMQYVKRYNISGIRSTLIK